MTLIVAIHVDDYLILTGDHRLTLECQPHTNLPEKIFQDGYKKIKYFKYGAITVSGDVILMEYFFDLLQRYTEQNNWNFIEIAQVARQLFIESGRDPISAKGTAFFTVQTFNQVQLIALYIREKEIEYETIPDMHAYFALFAGTPVDPIYQIFANSLRKVDKFAHLEDFYNYHLALIKQFYKRQQSFDSSITASFDLYIQHKKTGKAAITTIFND